MNRPLAALLLALLLAGIAAFQRGDRGEWRRFRAIADTAGRQRRYWRWTLRLWRCFALPAVVALVLSGRTDGLVRLPAEFRAVAAGLPHPGAASPALAQGMAAGFAIGLATVWITARLRGGRMAGAIGNVAPILPRRRAELLPVAMLAVSAGVAEELLFRLALPLLIALVTGSALAGLGIATLLFGAMHVYQGPAGIAATASIGALLMACFLATGALWVAIALHVGIDLSAMVVRPLLAGVWRR